MTQLANSYLPKTGGAFLTGKQMGKNGLQAKSKHFADWHIYKRAMATIKVESNSYASLDHFTGLESMPGKAQNYQV